VLHMIDGHDSLPSLPGKLESCKKGARQAPRPIVEFAIVGRVLYEEALLLKLLQPEYRDGRGDLYVMYVIDHARGTPPSVQVLNPEKHFLQGTGERVRCDNRP